MMPCRCQAIAEVSRCLTATISEYSSLSSSAVGKPAAPPPEATGESVSMPVTLVTGSRVGNQPRPGWPDCPFLPMEGIAGVAICTLRGAEAVLPAGNPGPGPAGRGNTG